MRKKAKTTNESQPSQTYTQYYNNLPSFNSTPMAMDMGGGKSITGALQYTDTTRQKFQQNLKNGLEDSDESLFGAMLGDDLWEAAVIQDGDHGARLIQLFPVVPNELLHPLLETWHQGWKFSFEIVENF